ncbi:MAG TPA: nucleotidyltransferase family protein, partial [Ilumatobacteraceae bacterium]|nr:nucleotidyltransferase family protein [Ilumatobacteraceae bacterium]
RLDQAGIGNVVLKGASLIPAYGGDWGVRDMADVDLLVDVADVPTAIDLLAFDGYVPHLGGSKAAVLARCVPRRHSWNFTHASGANIDLHWRVLQHSCGRAA